MQATVTQVIKMARQAGAEAAAAKLHELQAAGPAWTVHDTGLAGTATTENQVGTMLDLCGGAFIIIDNARTKVFKTFKQAMATADAARPRRDFTDPDYSPFSIGAVMAHKADVDDRWYLRRDDYRGRYILSIFDMTGRQEVSVNETAARAALEVLRSFGLEGHIETYID